MIKEMMVVGLDERKERRIVEELFQSIHYLSIHSVQGREHDIECELMIKRAGNSIKYKMMFAGAKFISEKAYLAGKDVNLAAIAAAKLPDCDADDRADAQNVSR